MFNLLKLYHEKELTKTRLNIVFISCFSTMTDPFDKMRLLYSTASMNIYPNIIKVLRQDLEEELDG